MKNQNYVYDVAFIFLLFFTALLTIPYHQGFLLGDDYLGAANQLLNGNWDIEHNFWANRIGSYLPYAIGMWIFGFGTWLTAITTLELLLLLLVVYIVLRKFNSTVAFVTAFLLGTPTIMLQNASVVMGDMAATLSVNAIVIAYFYFTFYVSKNKRSVRKWGVLIALLAVIAFLVKESVVFYVPLFVWLYWKDKNNVETKNFWKYAFVISVIAAVLLILVYWHKTGDPLFRIHAVEGGPSESDCNYARAGWRTLLNRLSWQPFQFLMENYSFGSLLLLSILQIIHPYKSSDIENFFKIYFLSVLGMWWFGSQGISHYNPVALVHRLWLPLLVPMAINSSFFILHVIQGSFASKSAKIRITTFTLLFLVFSFSALYNSYHTILNNSALQMPNIISVAIWYAVISFSVILAINTNVIMELVPSVRSIFFCIIMLPFISGGLLEIVSWAEKKNNGIKSGFELEKEMVQYAVSLQPRLLITDYRVAHFYYAYIMDMDKKLPIKDYNFVSIDTVKKGDYLLLNPERQFWFEKNINVTLTYTNANYTIADFVKNPEKRGFVLVKENATDRLYRYEGLSKN